MNSDYAMRAMMLLAVAGSNEAIPIAQISKTADIPELFLRKIIPRLQRAGLLRTVRGNQGSISLARPADSISILDIIIPIEGNLGMHRCVMNNAKCDRKNDCNLYHIWLDIEIELRNLLAVRNLEQLAGQYKSKKRI